MNVLCICLSVQLNEQYDPEDTQYIVRLHESFNFRHHLCLVFELLSINIFELLKQNRVNVVNILNCVCVCVCVC